MIIDLIILFKRKYFASSYRGSNEHCSILVFSVELGRRSFSLELSRTVIGSFPYPTFTLPNCNSFNPWSHILLFYFSLLSILKRRGSAKQIQCLGWRCGRHSLEQVTSVSSFSGIHFRISCMRSVLIFSISLYPFPARVMWWHRQWSICPTGCSLLPQGLCIDILSERNCPSDCILSLEISTSALLSHKICLIDHIPFL